MQFILNNLFCLKDFTKGAGLKWNALPTQDKEAYLAEARPKFEEYKIKLKEWETNMVAQGHENVVSKGFRNKLQRSLKNYSVKERLNKARLKKAILVRKQADLTIQKAKKAHKASMRSHNKVILGSKSKKQISKIQADKIKSSLINPKKKKSVKTKDANALDETSDSSASSSSESEAETTTPKAPNEEVPKSV